MFNLRMLLSCFISYLIFSDKRVFYLNLNITRLVRSDIRNWVTLVSTLIYGKRMHHSPTSSNGHLHNVHLSTAATFLADRPYIDLVSTYLQRPPLYSGHFFSGQTIHWLLFQPIYNVHLSTAATFLADSPYIDSCFNLSTTATSLQWKLSSVPKVAVLERFKIIWGWRRLIKVVRGDYIDIGSGAMQRLSDCKNYTRKSDE